MLAKRASVSKIDCMIKQASAQLIIPVLNVSAAAGTIAADTLMRRYASGVTRRMISNADAKLQVSQENKDGRSKKHTSKS